MVLSKIGFALLGGAGVIAASGCAYDDGMRYNQRSDTQQLRPAPPAYTHYRQRNTAAYGNVYLNASGRALYVRQRDRRNQSSCYGNCAGQWPPYLAYGNARPHGQWSIINAATEHGNGPMRATRLTCGPATGSRARSAATAATVHGRCCKPHRIKRGVA